MCVWLKTSWNFPISLLRALTFYPVTIRRAPHEGKPAAPSHIDSVHLYWDVHPSPGCGTTHVSSPSQNCCSDLFSAAGVACCQVSSLAGAAAGRGLVQCSTASWTVGNTMSVVMPPVKNCKVSRSANTTPFRLKQGLKRQKVRQAMFIQECLC